MLSLQERLEALEEDANAAEVESVESTDDKVHTGRVIFSCMLCRDIRT